MLDNHSVLSSLGLVSASVSSDIKFLFQILPDVLRKPFTLTSLMKSPSQPLMYFSRVLWPLQPVQSNFHPLMTMAESNEPTTSSLCHKDFKSCSQAQDLHDELPSSYGGQGRPGS